MHDHLGDDFPADTKSFPQIPQKLAAALTQNNARAFSTSYVMLSGMGIMPFQLVNFGQLFFIGLYRALFNLTPRGASTLMH